MGKFTDALQFWTKPMTRGVRAVTGNLDEEEQQRLRQEQDNLFQTILKTTSPFRMGANVLAQNYGPAIRGMTGGDPLERSGFEEWTAGALTPEEQDYLERKPYMAALKSSAGMTTSLMPFATKGLATANYAANPLLNKTLQYGLSGGAPGGFAGFGYSREGKELGDTLMGAGIGTALGLGRGYAFDPEYRNLVNEGYRKLSPPGSKYQAALQFGNDPLEELKKEAMKYDNPEDFNNRMGREKRNQLEEQGIRGSEQIERFWKENVTPKTPTLETLNPTGNVVAEYDPQSRMSMELGENITTLDKTMGRDPDELITIYRGAPKSQGSINPGDYVTTNYDLAKSYTGEGNVLSQKVRLGDILDDITESLDEEYIYRPGAWESIQERLGVPFQERLLDNRTLGEAVADDQAHLAKLKGEGYGNEYLYLDDKPMKPPRKRNITGGPTYDEQAKRASRLSQGNDLLEDFLQKYRDLGIIR